MPKNTTGLGVAGCFKWIFIISSLPLFVKAYQGFVLQATATGTPSRSSGRVGNYVTGEDAVSQGWQALGVAFIFLTLAWALWFFWQRNEE